MKKSKRLISFLRICGRSFLALCITVAAASVVSVMSVQAAEVTQENFDYEWYLEQHPDLGAVIPAGDTSLIWNFYQTTGKMAGWGGRVAPQFLMTQAEFDYIRYANENPDLMAVFGLDQAALYQHYCMNGRAEGRKGYSTRENTNARLKIYELADTVTAGCGTSREKVQAVHDWMVKNIAYDYDNYVLRNIPRSSYGVEGAILHGKAVCQGYAEAFSCFMDALGIECEMIRGTANNGNGIWAGHAWNKVELDGVWYYIDVTWDDPLPDRGDQVYWYKYYLITDPTFGGDHQPAEK